MENNTVIKPKVGAKDFFLHLGAVVGLFWSTISFIQLVTEIINYKFPDAISGYYEQGYYSGTIRYAIASLIIVFPIFLLLSWLNQREIKIANEKREIWIRKWLLMITLFVAGITIVVDLVIFLNTFLGGELTTRFVLKALTVFLVASIVFGHYIWELRTVEIVSFKRKLFAGVSAGLVLLALVLGFVTVGSPSTARLIRFDEQRVFDLQNIQQRIINHWQSKSEIPDNLMALEDSISGWITPLDPETNVSYEYTKLTKTEFELCATFNLSNIGSRGSVAYPSIEYYPNNEMRDNWQHKEGRQCFSRSIDSELYPVYKR